MATFTDYQLCCWLQKSVDSASSVETKACCQLPLRTCAAEGCFLWYVNYTTNKMLTTKNSSKGNGLGCPTEQDLAKSL